ncbi:MAG: hypothetical protein HKO65_15195 [Gemmatimonadetes bacterium]|nr:hypothetical protein [Gemmatimonadota bacterium]
MRTVASVSLLILALSTHGCDLNGTSVNSAVVSDSAGVTIVENSGPAPVDGGGWDLAEAPSLSIGTVEGEEVYQFFGIGGIHRFSDGRIGVVNSGSREIRIYGPNGVHLRSFGQKGSGPEEFEAPVLAGTVGDTLIVVDRAHHRMTFVHPDEGIVGLARVSDGVGGFLNPVGSFVDGQTVYGGAFDMRKIGELKNGMNRAGTYYRSSGLDGSLVTDFGDKPGAEFFIKDLEAGGQDARPAVIPFGRIPEGTVSPNFFFFTSQDRYEIEVFDPAGNLVRLIRLADDPIPVTPADGQQHIERVVEQVGSPAQEAGIRAQFGSLPLPAVFPPHAGLLADRMDYLWVEDFQRPGAENRAWNIFDPDGLLVGRVTFPERFNPTEIGPDYVLGLGWDEMNVEYVRMFALTRGSPGG